MQIKKIDQQQIKIILQDSWRILIGGIVINMIVGCFYSFGNVSVYIASYLKSHDPNVSIDDIAFIFPLTNITMNLLIPFGEKYINHYGHRQAIFTAIFVLSSSFYILSFVRNYTIFLIIIGLVIAPIYVQSSLERIFILNVNNQQTNYTYGLLYMLPFFCTWKYFPLKLGEINAVLQASFGFGAGLFTYITYESVNFQNEAAKRIEKENNLDRYYFEECISYNVPLMFKVLSCVIATLGIFALCLLWKPTKLYFTSDPRKLYHQINKDEYLDQYRNYQFQSNKEQMENKKKDMVNMSPSSECVTLSQGIKSPQFILLTIMAIFTTFFGAFVISYYKIYGLMFEYDDFSLTCLGSISFLFFGASRLIWLNVIQKFGFKYSFYALILSLIIFISVFVNFGQNFFVYCLSVFTIIFLQGGLFSWFSNFTPKVFGYRYSSMIFGLILMAFALANLILHSLTYMTLQLGYLSFYSLYLGSIIMLLISGVICIKYNDSPQWI